jgi:CO/xanthine dehydrogenase FAD-binding subunit
MDLPVREVMRPATLAEALTLLAGRPDARPIAGGTDLVVQLRDGRRHAAALVDLGALDLAVIAPVDGALVLGAAARMDAIATHPLVRHCLPALARAAGQIGAWPIQCRATLGGNLANASPAADTAPALLVADAEVVITSTAGERRVPLQHFFLAPGCTALAPGELIVAVAVPLAAVPPGISRHDSFVKVGPRREQVIAVASLAARLDLKSDGEVADVRVALGSVAPTPVRAPEVERFLRGRKLDQSTRHEAARVLQRDIAPIDDVRAPVRYRRIAAAVLLDRALAEAAHG